MRVLSLDILNILSIEKASLKFEDSGLVLVEGWNYDTGRANAAGKTAIFNCLSFGLFDKLPRKITASEILRRGSKEGSVSVTVACGENIWTVQRSRPKGVKFFRDGVEQNISQSEFEGYIRLNYDQFLLTTYTAQANSSQHVRFLESPDSSKKSFLLQLLGLDTFATCKTASDGRIKELLSNIELENHKITSNQAKIDAYSESLIDVGDANEQILALDNAVFELEQKQITYSAVSGPDLSKYIKLEEDARKKQNEIISAKTKRTMLHDKYRDLSKSLHPYDPDVKCFECGNLLDNEERQIAHEAHQKDIKVKLLEIKKQIDACDEAIYKEQAINDMLKKIREKKEQESSEYRNAAANLSEVKSLIRSNQLKKENILLKLQENTELQNKINILNRANEKIIDSLSNHKKHLELYKTLSNMYSPTGAQAYVLDSIIDSFNEVIQKYIDMLSPNMSYILNSYKETAKGDIVAKFSETLTKNGTEVSVGSLSGGEQKGVSLCVDFALLEVLETQFGMDFNPIILDEPFDGLDATGREIVIELLGQLAKKRQIMVIDHSSEAKTLFSKVIRVELRNDISTINLGT